MSPHVVVIQHLEPEQPYAIARAFDRAGIDVRVVRSDLGDEIPSDLDEVLALVVMGGPMSVTSDDGYPSRADELDLVRRALDASVPVLGVCLGAQLLALAAGGTVGPGDGAEIGWAPIEVRDEAEDDPLFAGLPRELTVLHWHGETSSLPPGASWLARSARYDQQAFRVGPSAWGLQFHVEVDAAAVAAFVESFPEDAAQAVGGADAVLAATPAALEALVPRRDQMLDRFVRLVADGAR